MTNTQDAESQKWKRLSSVLADSGDWATAFISTIRTAHQQLRNATDAQAMQEYAASLFRRGEAVFDSCKGWDARFLVFRAQCYAMALLYIVAGRDPSRLRTLAAGLELPVDTQRTFADYIATGKWPAELIFEAYFVDPAGYFELTPQEALSARSGHLPRV